ncbi:MAG TPA: peroxidase, partial [Blastocatellia bacterium]|nr:peroxidase [Blastocatellia bacterium]
WLTSVIPEITTSVPWADKSAKPATSFNIAFTYSGVTALGYEDTTKTFSREFKEGMAEENRSRMLGDTDASDPEKWELGGPTGQLSKDNIQILLMLYGVDWASLDEYARRHKERIDEAGGLKLLYEQDSYINEQNEEPFGFRDGLSQPAVEGYGHSLSDAGSDDGGTLRGEDIVKAGEFILGYPNEYNQLPITPTVPIVKDEKGLLPLLPPDPDKPDQPSTDTIRDFGQNGTYLVYRKLEQDVAGFWSFMNKAAGGPGKGVRLAAKFMGRWPSGAPLVLCPEQDDPAIAADPERLNDFKYHEADPHGFKCPKGSHIRRSNPRDSLEPGPEESRIVVNRHRIIRRGRPYGVPAPDSPAQAKAGDTKGIIFIAINASIKRQFEFVQQMWVDDQKFDGLYDNMDGVTGSIESSTTMTIQDKPVRRRIRNVPRFVTVKGGGYFFMPSIAALKYLSSSV